MIEGNIVANPADNLWRTRKEAHDVVVSLIEKGLTAQQIADALNLQFKTSITRNSVIGYAARKKLQLAHAPTHPTKTKIPKVKAVTITPPPPEPEPEPIAPVTQGYPFDEVPVRGCMWEMSGIKVRPRDMRFCGEPQAFDRPYCRFHTKKAKANYTPRGIPVHWTMRGPPAK
jgi:hypothetical protein